MSDADRSQWDRNRCRDRIFGLLDGREITKQCVDEMTRLDCWKDCIAQLGQSTARSPAAAEALLSFWNTFGLWSIPRGLKNNLPLFIDALRLQMPRFNGPATTLFRGQSKARYDEGVFGIAWTSVRAVAERFADLRDTKGIILRIEATPELIVAGPTSQSLRLEEFEYLVDPRMIESVETVD